MTATRGSSRTAGSTSSITGIGDRIVHREGSQGTCIDHQFGPDAEGKRLVRHAGDVQDVDVAKVVEKGEDRPVEQCGRNVGGRGMVRGCDDGQRRRRVVRERAQQATGGTHARVAADGDVQFTDGSDQSFHRVTIHEGLGRMLRGRASVTCVQHDRRQRSDPRSIQRLVRPYDQQIDVAGDGPEGVRQCLWRRGGPGSNARRTVAE